MKNIYRSLSSQRSTSSCNNPPIAKDGLLRPFSPRNDGRENERGNVFFYIFIAIALFAMLSYVVSRNNDSSSSMFTEEQAKLAAQEIIEYGNDVANAVQKLRLRGCSDTEISFENDIYTGYTNPNAPPDNSCHIFDGNGGNIEYARLPDPYFDESRPDWRKSYGFSKSLEIEDIGSDCSTADCSELTMIVLADEKLCSALNSLIGISTTMPTEASFIASPFDGVYNFSTEIGEEASSAELQGKTSGCFNVSATNNWYYQVLIAR